MSSPAAPLVLPAPEKTELSKDDAEEDYDSWLGYVLHKHIALPGRAMEQRNVIA